MKHPNPSTLYSFPFILILLLALPLRLHAGDPSPPPPVFNAADFDATSMVVDNPLWPMKPNTRWLYGGETEDGYELIEVTVLEDTRTVMGVECRVLLDRVYEDGELVESTFDWFAQDIHGNIWYFGEESYEFEDGAAINSDGSWEAGVDGALPGYVMRDDPMIGEVYRQEFYEGEAEDVAEVVSLTASVTLETGVAYTDLLQTFETTPLEPDAMENKYYAADIGLVREEQADGSEPIDLIAFGGVLKTGKLNIEHNATDEDTGFQGFADSEGWGELTWLNPQGEEILRLATAGSLANLGMTELFFETVEPENAEVSIAAMLAKLPEGRYPVFGPTQEAGESEGDTVGLAHLTHDIPQGPELLVPSEDAVLDPNSPQTFRWESVTRDIEGEDVEVIAYQLIVEIDGNPYPQMMGKPGSFSAYVPAEITRVTIPVGFLQPGTDYEWEVLAIEASGNQTLSSSAFSTPGLPPPDRPPFVEEPEAPTLKAARLIIEHNATDEDTGFQGFVDSEGWERLSVSGPGGMVLDFEGRGELGNLGLTELFFETVEPENAEVPPADILAVLPAGTYNFNAVSMENGESEGPLMATATLTHTIPEGPELLAPAEDAMIGLAGLELSWEPVDESIDGEPVTIIAYQLIVEKDEEPHENFIGKFGLSMYLPPDVTSIIIPDELLEPDSEYEWEVLAIEESGNQTLSSRTFNTAPQLPPTEGCDFTVFGGLPYFPLNPGHQVVLAGEDDGEPVQVIITVLNETRDVTFVENGTPRTVTTRVVEEVESEDGELTEISRNFFAMCRQTGDVFYFGEEVDDYEDGEIVGHDGAWLAGVDGALPGVIMPGEFNVGDFYYQEFAPDVAEDQAINDAEGLMIDTPVGQYDAVVQVVEPDPLEPDADPSLKQYAPGVGVVVDNELSLTDFRLGAIDGLPVGCTMVSKGNNPFFPLVIGHYLVLEGTEEDEGEVEFKQLEFEVMNETRDLTVLIGGMPQVVNTRVVEEREFIDGELYEISRNYYAMCEETGDVYYFGEDVEFFEDGDLIGTSGSWLAGVDDAQPGIIMPGNFVVGATYLQENAPDVAEDTGMNLASGVTAEVPAGVFTGSVIVADTNPLEPDGDVEPKTYAPGIGNINDADILKLVSINGVGEVSGHIVGAVRINENFEVGFDCEESENTTDEEFTVNLYDGAGQLVASTALDESEFTFYGLAPGNYTLAFDAADVEEAIGPLANPSALQQSVTVEEFETTELCVGLEPAPGKISGVVFFDLNNDGKATMQNLDTTGVPNVGVMLYRDGIPIDRTTSGAGGNYAFEHLPADDYVIRLDETTLPDESSPNVPQLSITLTAGECIENAHYPVFTPPTAVKLETFHLVRTGKGWIAHWTVGSERDTLGYLLVDADGKVLTPLIRAGRKNYHVKLDGDVSGVTLVEVETDLSETDLISEALIDARPRGKPTVHLRAEGNRLVMQPDPTVRSYLVTGFSSPPIARTSDGSRLVGEPLQAEEEHGYYFSPPPSAGPILIE